jgi:hypothetical protein
MKKTNKPIVLNSNTPAQAQHSPLPWTYWSRQATGRYPDYSLRTFRKYGISTADNSQTIADIQERDEAEANARLIVRACNNAERLADALRDIAARANFMLVRDPQNHQADYLLQQANKALAQWEGGK